MSAGESEWLVEAEAAGSSASALSRKRVVSSTSRTKSAADVNHRRFSAPPSAAITCHTLLAATAHHRQFIRTLHPIIPTHLSATAPTRPSPRRDTLFHCYWQCHSSTHHQPQQPCRPSAPRRPRAPASRHQRPRSLLAPLAGRGEPAMPPACSLSDPPAARAQ